MIVENIIRKDKISNALLRIVGIFLAVLFGMAICGAFIEYSSEDFPGVVFSAVMLVLAFWIIYHCAKRSKLISDAERLEVVLRGHYQYPIVKLARTLGRSEDNTRMTLNKILNRGYFRDVYYDAGNDVVNIGRWEQRLPAELVAVKCQACGAVSQIPKGKSASCEYCGSPIHG